MLSHFLSATFLVQTCLAALNDGGPALHFDTIIKRASDNVKSLTSDALRSAETRKQLSSNTTDRIFDNVPISKTLKFTPCLNVSLGQPPFYVNTYECARLQVPVDYSKPDGPNSFVLGVLKVPAINPASSLRGAFFLNQPFATNVNLTASGLGAGFQLGGLLDGFDIYAWDYRGQGDTTPQIQCIANVTDFNAFSRAVRSNDYTFGAFNGTFPPTTANIQKNIQSVTSKLSEFGKACARNYKDYLPYISSADHARDLNNIIRQLPGKPFISIYNYGYTTVLGATYAALYPNGFDRMIMDGTVDSVKVWSTGDNDPVTVKDSNRALKAFFDSCAASTPCNVSSVQGSDPNYPLGTCGGCYFWANTSAAVEARFNKLLSKYYYTPFKNKGPKSTICGDCEASYDFIYRSLSGAIAIPQDGVQFAMVSSLRLLEWERGSVIPGGAIEWFAKNFPANLTVYPPDIVQRCVDQPTAITGVAALQNYMLSMNASYQGLTTAENEVWCSDWPSEGKAANPYTGFKGGKQITTKGSILFIANSADPVYSAANAFAMNKIFANSGVVTLNEFGETSFFSGSSSSCLGQVTTPFTINGTLPPAGTYCNDVVNGAFNVPYQKDYRA